MVWDTGHGSDVICLSFCMFPVSPLGWVGQLLLLYRQETEDQQRAGGLEVGGAQDVLSPSEGAGLLGTFVPQGLPLSPAPIRVSEHPCEPAGDVLADLWPRGCGRGRPWTSWT